MLRTFKQIYTILLLFLFVKILNDALNSA